MSGQRVTVIWRGLLENRGMAEWHAFQVTQALSNAGYSGMTVLLDDEDVTGRLFDDEPVAIGEARSEAPTEAQVEAFDAYLSARNARVNAEHRR